MTPAMAHDDPPALRRAGVVAAALDPGDLDGLRRRIRLTLMATAALGSTGYLVALTVGTIAAAEIGGGLAVGGAPSAAMTLGTAVAASSLARAMVRVGRRVGMLGGLTIGLAGAVVGFFAILLDSLALLLLGAILMGFANGAGQMARYVAADLVPPLRRASAVGMVVWGSTVGAVIGPNLAEPGGWVAGLLALPALAGAYLLTMAFFVLALGVLIVFLRPEPYALADPSALERRTDGTDASVAELLERPSVVLALAALLAGQVVMVLIMTMTPLHLTTHGHGLDTVGLVLSAHTFGMFALSPISGRLTDRFGEVPIIAAGMAMLAIAAIMAALAPVEGPILTLALFLLGYGWNLGFVSGSALLTRGLTLAERTRVQGTVDGLVWGSAAVAGFSSGLIVQAWSYTTLGFLGLVLLIAPITVLVLTRVEVRRRLVT
ncbi:MAG TPA: MFS transporter [Candidatus Limnocylindria bacterium]|nr:MFS transporter [Candidatus Limnocylindria bacterium]